MIGTLFTCYYSIRKMLTVSLSKTYRISLGWWNIQWCCQTFFSFFFSCQKRSKIWTVKNLSNINVPNIFRKVGIKRELNCNSEISKTRCSSCPGYVHWNRRIESYLWDHSVGSVNVIHVLDTNLNLNRQWP